MNRVKIAPSLLGADFANLESEVRKAEEGGADLIHVDVMDGHFVPNISVGPDVVRSLRGVSSIPLDVHLMIEEPSRYIKAFAEAGSDLITVHVEACRHLHRVLQEIKSFGIKGGVALNPATPEVMVLPVLPFLDLIVVMSVNPGFGGQAFIPEVLPKIRRLSHLVSDPNLTGGTNVEIEVDGGIAPGNAREVARAGATILVAGSAVFGTPDVGRAIADIRVACSADLA